MNSENRKTSGSQRLLLNLLDKINLKGGNRYVALSNRSISYTWKNIKKSYKIIKFKISALTWNEEFELADGSCSVLGISDYFEYISKKHETATNYSPITIFPNKMESRITWYYLELLTPEPMKLPASTKSKITKDKNG